MFHYPKGIVSNYCYNNKFKLLILKVLISEARVKFNCGELASNSIEAELTAKKEWANDFNLGNLMSDQWRGRMNEPNKNRM